MGLNLRLGEQNKYKFLEEGAKINIVKTLLGLG